MAMVRPSGSVLVFFGQTNERAGEPARQILKNDLLDLVAGPAQPRAQQLDEFHRQRRLASHKGKKFAAVDDKNLAIGIGRGVGGPRLSIEHRHLPEDLAGADQIQNRAAAVGRGDADLHRAADHRNQAVAGIPLETDRGSPLERGVLGVAAELVERLRLKIAKIRMLAQDRQACCSKTAELHLSCPEARRLQLRKQSPRCGLRQDRSFQLWIWAKHQKADVDAAVVRES